MIIKDLIDEDLVNYKVPSMFICTSTCDFKCERECGVRCCQNSDLALAPNIDISDDRIIRRYLQNDITKSVVFGGLEPFDQFEELQQFIDKLRNKYQNNDDIVIYTGYLEDELKNETRVLLLYPNIIIKYGRFIPNCNKHFDEVLGVSLASDNQYAVKIS